MRCLRPACTRREPATAELSSIGERAFVVDQVLAKLRASYIREDVARKIEADIRARQRAGRYDRLTNAEQFVKALTRDLQAASGDKHLWVDFSADPLAMPTAAVWQYCLFVNVASLIGNVGYIKFDGFLPPGICAETAAAAMTLVAGRDALILDFRDNTGGDPVMVAFMSSYFFAEPVHLERRLRAPDQRDRGVVDVAIRARVEGSSAGRSSFSLRRRARFPARRSSRTTCRC